VTALLDRLATMRNPDGGWGTTADRPSSTEPTALALLAFATEPGAGDFVDGALKWLLAHQLDDGAWPVMPGLDEASWASAMALMAVQGRTGSDAALRRGSHWIAESRGAGVPWRVRLREWLRGSDMVELDPTLTGWSWAPDTFSWVEPTAWGILALRNAYPDRIPRAIGRRIDEGERMILDRTCPGGGWNYGNKVVLGVDLEPYPDTTAVALLGLQGRRDAPEVGTGLAALERMLDSNHSGLTLSLAALCYRAWDRDATNLHALIQEGFDRTRFLDEVRSIALAVLATTAGPVPMVLAHG
jgi:hypothetical protein